MNINKGDILYLLEWKDGTTIDIVPREVIGNAKLSAGEYSWEIYFKSSYNYSRSITQLGHTMFTKKEDAILKAEEYKEQGYSIG
jgi:hypothetical protein